MSSRLATFNALRTMAGLGLLWALSYLYSFLAQAETDAQSVVQTDVTLFAATVAGCMFAVPIGTKAKNSANLPMVCTAACALSLIGIASTAFCAYVETFYPLLLFAKSCMGLGQGLLYVLWGATISTREVEQIEKSFLGLIPIVAVILVAFVAVRFAVGGFWIAAVLYIAALPVASAFLLVAEAKNPTEERPSVIPPSSAASPPVKSIIVLFASLALLFTSMSFVWIVNLNSFMLDFSKSALAYAFGGGAAFGLIWASLYWTKRFDFPTLTRWITPIAILGALFASIGEAICLVASQVCFIAINVGLELMGRLLVVRAAERAPALRWWITAAGFSSIPIGGMVGGIAWGAVQSVGTHGALTLILCSLVLFVAVCAAVGWGETGAVAGAEKRTLTDAPAIDSRTLACKNLCEQGGLSERESEIFALLAQGRSRTFIRESLYISKGTVDVHITRIYQKLGVASKDELLALIDQAAIYCE